MQDVQDLYRHSLQALAVLRTLADTFAHRQGMTAAAAVKAAPAPPARPRPRLEPRDRKPAAVRGGPKPWYGRQIRRRIARLKAIEAELEARQADTAAR